MSTWCLNPFEPNRKTPRLWCRLVHQGLMNAWWSNDFGTWWISGRLAFEVACTACGDCWTQIHWRAMEKVSDAA